jgi:hypothetical protein
MKNMDGNKQDVATNRHGERCSMECGEGRHQDCTETFETCNCTYRGLHKTSHRYATIPEPVVAAEWIARAGRGDCHGRVRRAQPTHDSAIR